MLGAQKGTVTVRGGEAHITFTDGAAPLSALDYRKILIVCSGRFAGRCGGEFHYYRSPLAATHPPGPSPIATFLAHR